MQRILRSCAVFLWILRHAAAAFFVFSAAAARAGIVTAGTFGRAGAGGFHIAGTRPLDDVGGRTLGTKFVCHEAHVRIDVVEEHFVSGAQVIQAGFAVGSANEAMLGTFTVAGKAHVAFAAVARKGIALIEAELHLLRRGDHRCQRILHDVAEPVFRIDKVIARVEIAIVLHGHGGAARFAEDAETGGNAKPCFESDVENLDVITSYVIAHPFVENCAEKVAEIDRIDGPFRDARLAGIARLDQHETRIVGFTGYAFDNGDELHVTAADFFQEAVNLKRLPRIMAVHYGERVEFDAMLFQHVEASDDAVEGRLAAFVYAVAIMQLARTIDGEADEKVVLREKFAPFVVEQNTVCLKSVFDAFARGVSLLERDDAAKKVDTEQRWFSALPCKIDRVHLLRFDVLTDVVFENIVGHLPVGYAGMP